ncbi:hypothetical protein HDV05_002946, partial [Chytridiales sp. JEL 0842]
MFAGVYKVLAYLNLDTTELFVVAPKLVQAFFAALNDYYTHKLAVKLFGPRPAKWALVASLLSFFNFFAGVRTYTNSMEMTLTAVSQYFWPWPSTGPLDANRF